MQRRLYRPEHLSFRPIAERDHALLYRIQRERYANPVANIVGMAAAELPSYEHHQAFLRGHPYRVHHIVAVEHDVRGSVDVGTINLDHEGTLGCFLLAHWTGRGIGVAACYKLFREEPGPIRAFINPANRPSWRTVERLGMQLFEQGPERLGFELRGAPLDPYERIERRHAART